MKKQITLRIDEDVLEWFKSGGEWYQTRMNYALRNWMNGMTEVDNSVPKIPDVIKSADTIYKMVKYPDAEHQTSYFRPMPKTAKGK